MKLRGHHLICLNFLPEALGPEFTRALREFKERALGGEEVEIVEGPDELCSACPYLGSEGCTNPSEEEIAELDKYALEMLNLRVGERVRMDRVREILREKGDQIREFCSDCEFRSACEPEIGKFLESA